MMKHEKLVRDLKELAGEVGGTFRTVGSRGRAEMFDKPDEVRPDSDYDFSIFHDNPSSAYERVNRFMKSAGFRYASRNLYRKDNFVWTNEKDVQVSLRPSSEWPLIVKYWEHRIKNPEAGKESLKKFLK